MMEADCGDLCRPKVRPDEQRHALRGGRVYGIEGKMRGNSRFLRPWTDGID